MGEGGRNNISIYANVNNEIKSKGVDSVKGDPACPYHPRQMYVKYEIHIPLALI